MIHVPHVQLELPFPGKCVAAVDLSPPGDARFHLVPSALGGCCSAAGIGATAGADPPRTYLPVSTLQSCGSSSRLVRRMKAPSAVKRSSSGRGLPALSRVVHSAEFGDPKRTAAAADAHLAEQHGTAHPETDREGERGQNGSEQNQPAHRGATIDNPFPHQLAQARRGPQRCARTPARPSPLWLAPAGTIRQALHRTRGRRGRGRRLRWCWCRAKR
jgi:hypothetical protein